MTYRGPETLWHEHRRDERLAALDRPHTRALNDYRDRLQLASGRDVPNFDPFDGGVHARLLILLETPGPSEVECHRRFVSIDNPTGTAKNLRQALAETGISRDNIVLWNAVPWVRATRTSITASERRDGKENFSGLLPLLPDVEVAILAGSVASAARELLESFGIKVILSPHPSPTLINTSMTQRHRLHEAFETSYTILNQSKMSIETS